MAKGDVRHLATLALDDVDAIIACVGDVVASPASVLEQHIPFASWADGYVVDARKRFLAPIEQVVEADGQTKPLVSTVFELHKPAVVRSKRKRVDRTRASLQHITEFDRYAAPLILTICELHKIRFIVITKSGREGENKNRKRRGGRGPSPPDLSPYGEKNRDSYLPT